MKIHYKIILLLLLCANSFAQTSTVRTQLNTVFAKVILRVQYGTYTQEACYVNNVYQSSLSGSLPTTVNTPTYLHQVCMAQIVLQSMIGKTVAINAGSAQPQYWDYNSANSTLSFQMPYLSGGIPFSFKISGEGACYDKTILFFNYLDSNPSFTISPNPANEALTITTTNENALVSKNEVEASNERLEYSISIYDVSSGELLYKQKNIKGNFPHQIDVSKLRKGLYNIQIAVEEGVQTIKFLKE